MSAILVPTDFSSTAKNALWYAIDFAEQLNIPHIILYNAYQQPVTADPLMNVNELFNIDDLKKISEEGLKKAAEEALSRKANLSIETISEFNLLTAGIEEICKTNTVDYIVMGITGGDKLEETLMGSNTLHVAKHVKTPLIIVPPQSKFTPIEEVVLATDFKDVIETVPADTLKQFLDKVHPKLFVLNIDYKNKEFTPETPFESLMLDTLLEKYQPEYHFAESKDFVEAFNNFAEQHNADLIITIPKKRGLFEGIFKKSHTKKLAFHSHIPLLLIHS